MGKITGFLEIDRHDRKYTPVEERLKHYREFVIPLSEKDTRDQAARCMNCGIPYCHGTGSVAPGTPGCPVNNQIPDFNDLVYQGNWEEASRNLHSTNNFPRVHRPHLPGAVRGVLHAQHRRQPGHHQDHRMRHRRSRLGQWLAEAGDPRGQDRQEGRDRRLRPRRPCRRAAARARRP
jgi:hypothetical protein